MSNDVSSGNSSYKYDWNPFQDLVDNNIVDEPISANNKSNNYQPIIVPRCGPFFATDFTIKVKESGRELSFELGDYSFIYPYMTFLKDYQRLVYGGILLHNQPKETNYLISYSTIGGEYVFDDINYTQFVANIGLNERTANWEQLVNLPSEFPPDPHTHPAKDTVSYLDMITWMKSYLDALVGIDTSLTIAKQFNDHIQQPINKAHSGGLPELGITHLKDFPIVDDETIKSESTQILTNVWAVKNLIRSYINGDWS